MTSPLCDRFGSITFGVSESSRGTFLEEELGSSFVANSRAQVQSSPAQAAWAQYMMLITPVCSSRIRNSLRASSRAHKRVSVKSRT